ncbi:DUF5518 domain-containing protein [Haloarcula onubensis]|uniref:DUF5518 domain-containing protein n=1 Tax=Haloarcula onubensis TaxID=2950539 RepID=A0ABU2FUN9_9EURY|nr:DUF5518 domain-containing protein [Halomicroarcula sp. S3CR25-11]MDS0284476.1 DUF5518 domain-containing protein [Halomicroarcula sp. S3CR25-11]
MASSLRIHSLSPAWRFALIGVSASLPATVVLNWLPDSQATVGGSAMIVGAFIAGGLAATRSADSGATGLRAGLLGGVIGLLTFVVTVDTTAPWPVSRVLFWGLSGIAVLCVAPLFGLGCGRLGGWVANAVISDSKTGAETS